MDAGRTILRGSGVLRKPGKDGNSPGEVTAPDSAEFEIVTDKIRHHFEEAKGAGSEVRPSGRTMRCLAHRGLQALKLRRPKPILLRARTSGLGCGLHLEPAETEVPTPEIARGSTFKFGRRHADECIDTALLAMGYFKSSDFLRRGEEEGGQACLPGGRLQPVGLRTTAGRRNGERPKSVLPKRRRVMALSFPVRRLRQ